MDEPDFSTPEAVREYLYDLGMCGCMDKEAYIKVLRDMLEWCDATHSATRPDHTTLFGGNVGVFYFFAGFLDNAYLTDHGVVIRYPFLTARGTMLLQALNKFSIEQITDDERNEP